MGIKVSTGILNFTCYESNSLSITHDLSDIKYIRSC